MDCCLGFFWDPFSRGVDGFLESSTGGVVSWLWNLVVGRILNLILLASRAEELDRETRALIAVRADLQVEIEKGESENLEPTHQALAWLEEVDKVEARATDFRVSFQQRAPSSGGSSLRFFDRLGCEAVECLKEVERLKTQRSNLPPLTQAPPTAEELRRETTELADLRIDLLAEIGNGELDNKAPTQRAKTWLREAEEIGARATDFLVSYQQRGASSEGSSLRSSNRLGCEAAECLQQVRRLKSERSSLPALIQAPPPAVVPPPGSSNYRSVGAEETLSEIRGLVMEDEEAGIIGIYGMGGIGKTTFLNAINNELHREGTRRFDLVIWVTVSKQVDVWKIQEDIAVRLGYSRPSQGQGQTLPEHPTDRVQTLLSALSKKKFLLLLDDLWEKLDLGDVGVPVPSLMNGSKLVFTTRLREVCDDMDAKEKVKVPLLDPASSWELFCQKLGRREDQWDPSVRSLAEAVCKKCGGLPITLITVGRAMAGATTPGEWEEALMGLRGVPAELRGMKDEVLIRLKFSFDKLTGKLRECLLYCALFPEDHSIEIQRLIDYWVGEGLLESEYSPDSIDRARNRGLRIITSLKSACLLEDGGTEGKWVNLHDTVREMALWITSGKCDGENGNVFLVNSGERLTCVPTPERWTEATRISLRDNEISVLPEKPQCHNLHTLLLYRNHPLKEIPGGFFQFMPRLRVLDLLGTGISHLPPGIGSLVELRYLDLSHTSSLESLPVELGRLTKLRQLRLVTTLSLKRIPREAISSLAGLQSLNMYDSRYKWRGGWEEGGSDLEEGDHEGRQLCLKDLDGLGQLTELSLSIRGMTDEDIQALQKSSERLCASFRWLQLKYVTSKSFDLSICLEIMKGLRKLRIEEFFHLEELILNTSQLSHCPQLEELELRGLLFARISWTDGIVFERGPSTATISKNLVTLRICCNPLLREIPGGFFQFMPRLRELNLSGTGISHLPPGIGSLVELRYLDLSYNTDLLTLPVELGRLTKLRQLCLKRTSNLKSIPQEAISSLAGLQSLNMDGSGYEWRGGWEEGGSDWEEGDHEGRQLCLKDLDGMGQLTELHLSIINGMTQEGMQALQKNSGRLCASIRWLELNEVGSKSFDLSTCLEIMKGLRELKIVDCRHLEELILNTNQLSHCPQLVKLELRDLPLARISWTNGIVSERGPSTAAIFKNFVELSISNCGALEDVTWIRDLPSIETVKLSRCSKIVNQLSHCPQLKRLKSSRLPLARISWTDGNMSERGPSTAAIFKNLVNLTICSCEELEDIMWIRDLPCMKMFCLFECPKIEELVVVEEVMMSQNVADFDNDSFFPKLKEIHLGNLPNLRSICRHLLLFPSLESIHVSDCPELKKLPLGLPSAKNIKKIIGEQEWWDALEWDHEDVRSKFTPYFRLQQYEIELLL